VAGVEPEAGGPNAREPRGESVTYLLPVVTMMLMNDYESDLTDTHEDPAVTAEEPSDAVDQAGFGHSGAGVEAALQAFAGTWRLDARECVYQDGDPPRSSTQRIDIRDGRVIFHVESVLSDGWDVSYVLSRIPDGVERRHSDPLVADTLCTRIDGRTLETISRRGDLITRHTIRTLSEDGSTLSVTQIGVNAFGRPFRNRSLYHRA
jgi:hypothetical protein